jgi:hypothetical protein
VLETAAAAAGAEVVAAELFFEQFVAVDDSDADFNVRFRGVAVTAFAHRLESRGLRSVGCAWDTSVEKDSLVVAGHEPACEGSRWERRIRASGVILASVVGAFRSRS